MVEARRETGVTTLVIPFNLQDFAQRDLGSTKVPRALRIQHPCLTPLCLVASSSRDLAAAGAMPRNRSTSARYGGHAADERYDAWGRQQSRGGRKEDPSNPLSLVHLHGMKLLNGFLGTTSLEGLRQWNWKDDPELKNRKVLLVCAVGGGKQSAPVRGESQAIARERGWEWTMYPFHEKKGIYNRDSNWTGNTSDGSLTASDVKALCDLLE